MINESNFPKTVKKISIVDNQLTYVESKFNLVDLLPKSLVDEFGLETVLKSVQVLNLTFLDLITYSSISTRNKISLPSGFYDVYLSEKCHYTNDRKEKIEYTVFKTHVCSDLNYGQIFRECLLIKFPKFKVFEKTEIKKFDPYTANNSHIIMSRIPEYFQKFSVKELLSMNGVQEYPEKSSLFKCYSSDINKLEKYVFYLEINSYSLYIPYEAIKKLDFNIIEAYTTNYFNSYYKDENKKNEALMIFDNDKTKEFSTILNQLKNEN